MESIDNLMARGANIQAERARQRALSATSQEWNDSRDRAERRFNSADLAELVSDIGAELLSALRHRDDALTGRVLRVALAAHFDRIADQSVYRESPLPTPDAAARCVLLEASIQMVAA